MAISYTPQFSHKDWIDFVDSVQAGGTNGINIRFHRIEAEFATISSVIAQILQEDRTVSVPPVFTLAGGQNGWDMTANPGVAQKTAGLPNAFGAVAVTLPAGAQIGGFRALGKISGSGTLSLDLMRQRLDGGGQVSVINITVTAQANPSFDVTKPPVSAQGFDLIDPGFSYFILAHLSGAGGNDTVSLTGFQILYQAH